jgi:SNF2 family DNA or RNA helicase
MSTSAKRIALIKRKEALRKRIRKGNIILPSALQAFRERTLQDYNWLKEAPRLRLLTNLKGFKFHTVPWKHQLVCVTLATSLDQFLFFLDMGAGGKTKSMLDALYYRKLKEGLGKTLVLVPSAVNVLAWLDQVDEHRPELRAVGLLGNREERMELLEQDVDIYVLNYDGLMSFLTQLSHNPDPKKRGRVLNHRAARDFAALFDAVICDEIHLVGNQSSLRYRMTHALRKRIKICFGLTGTPFGRNPEKMWSQFFLVDRGETLGETLGLFRAAYFNAKDTDWGYLEFKFEESYTELLHKAMRNSSIRYEEKEIADVPDVQRIKHRVTFGVDAEEYYKRVREELFNAKGNLQEMQNSFIRMRQACAGFLSVREEEGEGDKVIVPFYTNPKLEALEVLIDSLPEDEKVIIFHEFIFTGQTISEMLTRKKIKWARVGGKHKAAQAMTSFLTNPKCTMLIANNHSGVTTGINPQHVCRRIVYFDSPVDPITRKQSEKRVDRPGQKRRVYLHDLMVANSVDETVRGFIEEGKNLFDALINGKVKKEML